MANYVLGFMFSPDYKKVVLIRKVKPDWQQGKLNGVGGRIEEGEPAIVAIVREFTEETGLTTRQPSWVEVSRAIFDGGVVYVYACASDRFDSVKTTTEEKVGVYPADEFEFLSMPNLKWLVPLCAAYLRIPHMSRPSSPIETYFYE